MLLRTRVLIALTASRSLREGPPAASPDHVGRGVAPIGSASRWYYPLKGSLATHPISTSPETVLPIPLQSGGAPPLEGALLTYPLRWLTVDVDDSPCECGAGVAEDQAEAPGVHSRWEFY